MCKKKRRRREAQTIAKLGGHKKMRTHVTLWLGPKNVPNGPKKNVWHPKTSDLKSNQLIIKVSLKKFFSLKHFYTMSRHPTSILTIDTKDERTEPQPSG